MNKRAKLHPAKLPKHVRGMGYRFAAIFSTATLLIIFLFFFSMRHNIITDIQADSTTTLENIEHSLQENIDYLTKPLDVIAKLPQTQNFLYDGSDKVPLSSFFDAIISEAKYYYQFRLLDINGVEQLRYDRIDDEIVAIPSNELQDKSDRYYFDALKQLSGNSVYISPVDYNMENGILSDPLVPTIRFAQAIYTNQVKSGYVVANIYADRLFHRLDHTQLFKYSHLYLVNDRDNTLYASENAPDILNLDVTTDDISTDRHLSSGSTWESYNGGYLSTYTVSVNTLEKTYDHSPTWHLIYLIPPQTIYYYEESMILATILGLFIILPFVAFAGYKFGTHRASTKLYHQQLMVHATKDELTGLYNRRKIMSLLEEEMARQRKDTSHRLTIIFIDVNDLKFVNDTFGHTMGDQMLKEATKVLLNALRSTDYLARLGGDEFLAILPNCPHDCFVDDIIQRCDTAFHDAGMDHCKVPWIMSYGYTSYSPDDTIDTFIKRADHFMYRDKNKKKGLA